MIWWQHDLFLLITKLSVSLSLSSLLVQALRLLYLFLSLSLSSSLSPRCRGMSRHAVWARGILSWKQGEGRQAWRRVTELGAGLRSAWAIRDARSLNLKTSWISWPTLHTYACIRGCLLVLYLNLDTCKQTDLDRKANNCYTWTTGRKIIGKTFKATPLFYLMAFLSRITHGAEKCVFPLWKNGGF